MEITYPVFCLVLIFLFLREMSKMMRDKAKYEKLKSSDKKVTQYTKVSNKNASSTDKQPGNDNKRMKHNLNSRNVKSVVAHGTSITNWEKFKNIIKDSTPEDKKNKIKPTRDKPFHRFKRNYNVGDPVSATQSSGRPTEKAKENKIMEKERNLLTKQVAIDCEMVGIGDGTDSMLARVSLVNRYGDCIYDKYVKPREKVSDYRTAVSGIRPHHLHNGEDFETVQREVAEILTGRVLVGHALKHDTDVLFLSHPRRLIRDTSRYAQFRRVSKGNTPSLKTLAAELLGVSIQSGEHNSVEDARTAMQLYILYKDQWETDIRTKR